MLSSDFVFIDKGSLRFRPVEDLGLFLCIEFFKQSRLGFKACIIQDRPFLRYYSGECFTTQQLRVAIYELLKKVAPKFAHEPCCRRSYIELPTGLVEESIRQQHLLGGDRLLGSKNQDDLTVQGLKSSNTFDLYLAASCL